MLARWFWKRGNKQEHTHDLCDSLLHVTARPRSGAQLLVKHESRCCSEGIL
jgi:hypothetical protein